MLNQIRKYRIELLIVLFVLGAMNAIFVFPAFRVGVVGREAAGHLGDFVGGYIGTLVALISALLFVRALKSQQLAENRQHFESRYFELIRMHRDNVAEMRLGKAEGRAVFVRLLQEFDETVSEVRAAATTVEQQLTQDELLELSYYILFYGVGDTSTPMLRAALNGRFEALVRALHQTMEARKEVARRRIEQGLRNHVPFDGHQSRLGHYYRHLFQSVCYVHEQTDIPRYAYIKTIRAQLSTQEQALLLINSMTELGHSWWERELIQKYRLVKNLPEDFFDRDLLVPSDLFEGDYFEWQTNRHPARVSPLRAASAKRSSTAQ